MQEEEPTTLAVGTTVRDPAGDQYIVEGLLGQGGFGAVYLVRDQRFKRSLFALKEVIDPDKRDRERFLFEGEVLERLHHWALPHVYRVFEHQKLKRAYILMDYIQGKNLKTLLLEQPERRFSLPLVLSLMAPIVDALVYLHHQDPPIVHCDLKPANIIMPERADETMLVDFGLAKEYVSENTTTVIRHGSPGYAAPEQYGSGTTPRTDIYGLGATFYTLLTGVVPVDAITRATGGNRMDPLTPASLITPDVPVAVAKTLQRAMSMSADDRFSTIEEFWQELTAQAAELPTPATSPLPSPPAPPAPPFKQGVKNASKKDERPGAKLRKRRARRRVLLTFLCALLLTGIIGASFWWYTGTSRNQHTSGSAHRSASTPAVVQTVHSTPTPGAAPAGIAGTYKGTIDDFTTNSSATMVLKDMRQNKGRITGFLVVGPNGPPVSGNGALSGTIDSNNNIQFIVSGADGQTVLFFQGSMQSPTLLNGNFYSCSSVQGGLCAQVPGSYGSWIVALAS